MVTPIEEFVRRAPRERSGTRSANRFDYQLSWAFCLLLDLEGQNRDYLLVLDYHDDVVVFDAENQPTQMDFYQIKTEANRNWTLTSLLDRANGVGLSIIGKLYSHRLSFEKAVRSLNFVGVVPIKLKTKDHPKGIVVDYCRLTDLCDEALAQVSKALQKEHELPDPPACDVEFILRTDALSVKDHATHAEGRLSRHLAGAFGDRSYNVSHAFKALIDELRRGNNFEGDVRSSFDLVHKKGVGRVEFSGLLKRCAGAASRERWEPVQRTLIQDAVDVFELAEYERAWETWELVRCDPSTRGAKPRRPWGTVAGRSILNTASARKSPSTRSKVTKKRRHGKSSGRTEFSSLSMKSLCRRWPDVFQASEHNYLQQTEAWIS
jgi:hypothetical protein